MGPEPTVFLVLVTGNFLGAVIKGITGFGSAIIHLCVWVVAVSLGLNAGTLQQAVLTECIASEVVAVPLLMMTRAHRTCDWGLVLSLSLFGAVGAPVGAAMLTHLPSRQVEFAVGCIMLLVILANCLNNTRGHRSHPDASCTMVPTCWGTDSTENTELHAAHDTAPEHSQPAAALMTAGQCEHDCLPATPSSVFWDTAKSASHGQHHVAVRQCAALLTESGLDEPCFPQNVPLCRTPSSASSSSCSSISSEEQCICLIADPRPLCAVDQGNQDTAALLAGKPDKQQPAGLQIDQAPCTLVKQAVPCSWRTCGSFIQLSNRWRAITKPEKLAALQKMLLLGSLAGSVSGVMAGLTGMGGPPVMLMFEKLQVPKDTVRGTNAICNVIQVRIFAYIAMGVFHRDDIVLYAAVSVAAMAGMLLGCRAAAHTNQVTFSRLLTALMLLCCVLMFASAAGVAVTTQKA